MTNTITTGALTVPQLAQLAGVHPQTIRRAIHAGELRAATGFQGKGHARISHIDAELWWRSRGGGTLLGDLPSPQDTPAPTDRKVAAEKGFGFLRGQIGSSDEFLRIKHDQVQAELEKDAGVATS